MSLDIHKIRADFPILNREVNGRPLVYFDNAATSQKPKQVIDKIVAYYSLHNANIHRGVHALSQEATDLFEAAREKTRAFFNIPEAKQVIFTSGNTHSINAVASGAHVFVKKGDEVIVEEAKVSELNRTIEALQKVYNSDLDIKKTKGKLQAWEPNAGAAKLFLTIYSDNTPLLDIEIRYKGSYTANPQFQAVATANFKKLFKG